jgi:hypothetical protein
MARLTVIVNCAILLLLAAGAVTAQTQGRGKWKVLFDGKSTDAWRGFKQESFPTDGWTIEDGALKAVASGKRIDIITKEKFSNFELELEWRVSPGGNSGIFYHVSEGPEQVWYTGPEMQVLDDSAHNDGKNEKTSAGSLYALMAPTGKVLRPVGEYNKVRLLVRGNHVEHWLNGKKIVEYDLGSDALKELIAASKFKSMPQFAREKEGHIALQHHGDDVWFRRIRIRAMPAK